MPALYNKHPTSFASPSPSFPVFTLLPHELATRILHLACRSPSPTSKHPSKRSPLSLDISTTLSLALTCKSMNKIITPLLYNAVRITRPSALLEILNTLEERPSLSKLIRRLHVGDECTLYQDDHDWPLVVEYMEDAMRLDYPVLWLKTSWVAQDEEENKLPRWCEPGRSWCLEPWRLDCRGRAVASAIQLAIQGVDVQPYRRGYAKSGKRIGVERWSVRIYKLQACLDLYLSEMRRIEDVRNYPVQPWRTLKPGPRQDPHICRLGECGHYPRFALGGGDEGQAQNKKKKSKENKNVFTVTRVEIWKHLTRRGAALDQFDHPIRFAKSTAGFGHGINAYGRSVIQPRLEGPNRSHFTPHEYDPSTPNDAPAAANSDGEEEDEEDRAANLEAAKSEIANEWPHTEEKGKTSNLPLSSPYAIDGLVVNVERLLTLTPKVNNLCLTGYLHLCLFLMPVPVFETITSLCLGPLLPLWEAGAVGVEGSGPALAKLENLRVVGSQLGDEEVQRFAGMGRGLKRLKRLQWELVQTVSLASKCVPGIPAQSIYEQICQLQGQALRGRTVPTSRLIEVRLHPSDVNSVLSIAPPHIRSAWQQGSPINGAPHRVRLVESGGAAAAAEREGDEEDDDGDEKAKRQKKGIRLMHRESRKWWEECAAGEGRGGGIGREGWMPNASAC